MGICASCCGRRRRKSRSYYDERQPLLLDRESRYASVTQQVLQKTLDCERAFRSGKLPSQDQIDRAIYLALNSELLSDNHRALSAPGQRIVRDLKDLGTSVIEFGEEKNYDDKVQNIIHNIRQLQLKPIEIPTPQTEEPLQDVRSFLISLQTLFQLLLTSAALRVLITNLIVLTRQLLASMAGNVANIAERVDSAAKTTKDVAEGVGAAAETAQNAAERWEEAAEAVQSAISDVDVTRVVEGDLNEGVSLKGKEEVKERVQHAVNETAAVNLSIPVGERQRPSERKDRQPDSVPESISTKSAIESIREIILQAHRNEEHLAALRTMVDICEKYIDRLHSANSSQTSPSTSPPLASVDVPNTIQTNPALPSSLRVAPIRSSSSDSSSSSSSLQKTFATVLADIKLLLERVAGGKSLDPWIKALESLVSDIRSSAKAPFEEAANTKEMEDLRSFFSDLRRIVDRSLDDETYLQSRFESKDEVIPSDFTKEVNQLVQQFGELLKHDGAEKQQFVQEGNQPRPTPLTRSHLHQLVHESATLVDALEHDRVTLRIIHALKSLEGGVELYVTQTLDALPNNIFSDLLGFIIPKVTGTFLGHLFKSVSSGTIPFPLPRVEVKMPGLESSVDMRGMLVSVLDEVRARGWFGQDSQVEEEYWWGRRASRVIREGSTGMSFSFSDSPSHYSGLSGSAMEHERTTVAELLTPKGVLVQRWNETRIEFGVEAEAGQDERTPLLAQDTRRYDSTEEHTSVSRIDRFHIKVDGLFVDPHGPPHGRILSFENIVYYANYTTLKFLGYKDEGVLDVDFDIDWHQKEGAEVEMDLQIDWDAMGRVSTSSASTDDSKPPLSLSSIKVTLPSSFNISPYLESHFHWILTSMLISPIVIPLLKAWSKREVENVIENAVKGGLENAGLILGRVYVTAKEQSVKEHRQKMEARDYWNAVVEVASKSVQSSDEEEGGEQTQTTETEVDLSLTGVKVTISDHDANQELDGTETEIAIGLTPQLLPSIAQPDNIPTSVEEFIDETQRVGDAMAEGVTETIETGVENVERATETVRGIKKGVDEVEVDSPKRRVRYSDDVDKREERRRMEGWKSKAFDLEL